tara:strand:+ start:4950 stop:5165 length:216 start_codon:yes stop_codon:yes gene_type:complete
MWVSTARRAVPAAKIALQGDIPKQMAVFRAICVQPGSMLVHRDFQSVLSAMLGNTRIELGVILVNLVPLVK